jgi:CheY-like chemotaxis protein
VATPRRAVLLVDDDVAIREALAEALVEEGFTVHAARHGREALDWLQQNGDRPCVVLLDLMMPVMDGRTFLAIRGADPSLSKVPVIVVSAESGCFELTRTHRVHLVLHKPIVWEGLVAAIEGCD